MLAAAGVLVSLPVQAGKPNADLPSLESEVGFRRDKKYAGPPPPPPVTITATGVRFDHCGPVLCVAFSPDGKQLAWGGYGQEVRLWGTATWKPGPDIARHYGEVSCLAFSPDGKILASGSYDRCVRLWDAQTGKLLHQLESHEHWVQAVALSPDGKLLASAGVDWALCLWDTQTGALLRRIPKGACDAVAFSPDGKFLATCSPDFSVCLREPATGKELRRLTAHSGYVYSLAFSPDGRLLLSGGNNHTAFLWDTATGQPRAQLEYNGIGRTAAFAPDGRTFVTGISTTGTVVWWETATAKERLRWNRTGIASVYFSPDGRRLATAENSTANVRALPHVQLAEEGPDTKLSAGEFESLWKDLADPDAARAYRAICMLCSAADDAVPRLRERIRPVAAVNVKECKRWISDLEDAQFKVRQAAMSELAKRIDGAEPLLRQALAGPRTLESIRRIEELLAPLALSRSAERLRQYRALEVLETLRTKAARGLLTRLADGAPGAWLTREAQAALKRLP
jgi:hypothetical protein